MSGDDAIGIHVHELFDEGERTFLFIHRVCTFQYFIKDDEKFSPASSLSMINLSRLSSAKK